ncbi:MAG: hypothetical protein NWE98_10970 [Candidatus Bathyarchaeota archaeon]|nr:hypothetical protein [Candidatus Bathyarchaeota archaeon]
MRISLNQTKSSDQNGKSSRAFSLSLLAGILILCNSALVGISAEWLPWLMPTLPGSAGNDATVLYTLSAVGVTCGALVLLGALMLRTRSASKAWGIFVAVCAIPSIICGGGFIIGVILAVLSGKAAYSARTEKSVAKPNCGSVDKHRTK